MRNESTVDGLRSMARDNPLGIEFVRDGDFIALRGARDPMHPRIRIDLAIKAGRDLRGMTQQDLADRLGIPRPNVSRWENGGHQPWPETVYRIAAALELSPRVFILGAVLGAAEATS